MSVGEGESRTKTKSACKWGVIRGRLALAVISTERLRCLQLVHFYAWRARVSDKQAHTWIQCPAHPSQLSLSGPTWPSVKKILVIVTYSKMAHDDIMYIHNALQKAFKSLELFHILGTQTLMHFIGIYLIPLYPHTQFTHFAQMPLKKSVETSDLQKSPTEVVSL